MLQNGAENEKYHYPKESPEERRCWLLEARSIHCYTLSLYASASIPLHQTYYLVFGDEIEVALDGMA